MVRVFAYGSLRKGEYNYARFLLNQSEFLGYGYVYGLLYTIENKDYPALLPGNRFIKGEIYEVSRQLAKEIDEMEGFHRPSDISNDYHKINVPVYDDQKNQIEECPVYFFNNANPDQKKWVLTLLESNDYVKR